MAYQSCTALLIEDDGVMGEIIGFRLELLGFTVTTVSSAEEAFRAAELHLPDIILLDLTLAGTAGIELVNRLSNHKMTSTVPILVLSTQADLKDVEQAHLAGANDYLVIPFEPTVFAKKVETLARTNRAATV